MGETGIFLEETSKRDIVVQLTLWDHLDLSGSFDKHPLNPENNITWNEGVISGYEDYYGGSVKENNEQVLDLQRKYVDKLLSLIFKYGNILYNMSNESSLGEEWEKYWAGYVKEKAKEQEKEIFITSMHLVPSNGVRFVMSNRELFDFVESSQNVRIQKEHGGELIMRM